MKSLKNITKKVIAQIVEPTIINPYGWPPTCSSILYEPERPTVPPKEDGNSDGQFREVG